MNINYLSWLVADAETMVKEWLLQRRWRVILAGMLLVAVPVLSLAFFVYLTMARDLEKLLIAASRDYAGDCVQAITDRLDRDLARGQAYASRPLMQALLREGHLDKVRFHLQQLVTGTDSLERAFISSPQGVLLTDYPSDPKVHGRDFSYRDWYRGVSQRWTPYVSEFFQRAAIPPRFLFNIAVPIRSPEGRILGILVMQPKDDYFQGSLKRTERKKVAIHILDHRGRIVYHSHRKIDQAQDFSSHPMVQKLQQGLGGEEKTRGLDSQDMVIAAYRPVPPFGWGVIAEKPVKEALAPFTGAIFSLSIFTLAVLVLGVFGAYQGANLLLATHRLTGELARVNAELQGNQQELAKTNARLQEASQAKSDFLANMSHELRTPLNAIIGFSEVLQDELFGDLNTKQKEYVQNIYKSGLHLLGLINDILDLAKVESGKMELELNSFSLKEALESSLVMVKEKAMKQGIALSLEVEPEAEGEITLDERKFKQIMFNLLSNAVKFTPRGGRVTVSARRWEPEKPPEAAVAKADRGFLEISVADSGMGIKPEDLGRLFQEFTQLGQVYTKAFEGTGLGLALTKRLVELQGGRIRVESEPGQGSRFSFTVPREAPGLLRPIFAPSPIPLLSAQDERVILLIDDDPQDLAILEEAVRSKGVKVIKADSGQEGLDLAQRLKPDLIILDLLMPQPNGFEVLETLKSTEETAPIPIIIFTIMDLSPQDKAQLAEKTLAFFEKGVVSKEAFVAQVQQVLGL
jgi:signal transduction histidine kinase/CheY-like chemotaxis protein